MNHKIFNFVLFFLFLIFLTLYFSANIGLIDYQSKYRKELTEEEILKFEEDIKNGIEIDMNVYRKDETRYNNTLSKITLKVSNSIGNMFQSMMNYFFKQIEKSVSNPDN